MDRLRPELGYTALRAYCSLATLARGHNYPLVFAHQRCGWEFAYSFKFNAQQGQCYVHKRVTKGTRHPWWICIEKVSSDGHKSTWTSEEDRTGAGLAAQQARDSEFATMRRADVQAKRAAVPALPSAGVWDAMLDE